MMTHNIIKDAENKNLTRRKLLTTGCMALSSAGIGLSTHRLLGGVEDSNPVEVSNIDPGYIGPQFFDKHEEQALLEVLESGSPFRFWGPSKLYPTHSLFD